MVDKRFTDEIREAVVNHLKLELASVQETVTNEKDIEVVQTRVKATLYWMQGNAVTFIDDSEVVVSESPVVTNPVTPGIGA